MSKISWRKRKRGTPRQIGKKFPVLQKKKLPAKIRALRKPVVEYMREMPWGGKVLTLFKIDDAEVGVYSPGYTEYGEYHRSWTVVWDGAVDFMGTKKEMLKRYPELRGRI